MCSLLSKIFGRVSGQLFFIFLCIWTSCSQRGGQINWENIEREPQGLGFEPRPIVSHVLVLLCEQAVKCNANYGARLRDCS